MLLRSGILFTATAGLVAAAGNVVIPRDFEQVKGALDNINALLLQINERVLQLNVQNVAIQGPALVQLGTTIQPTIDNFNQQVEASAPLNVDETNGLNTARTAFIQNVNLTMSDLIAQKPLLDSVSLSPQVADALQQVRDGAAGFFGEIQKKLAPSVTNTDISTSFTESLNVFDMAIAMFRGQNAAMPAPAAPAPAPAPAAPAPAPAAPALPPTKGQGTTNADGSCSCSAVCPVGALM